MVCLHACPSPRAPSLCPDDDHARSCRAGSHGKKLRDEILHKIEKWQEPPPAKQIKPIALPDDTVRKRRGGKRYVPFPAHPKKAPCASSRACSRCVRETRHTLCRARRAKARIAMTEMRKQANRVSFGVAEEETFYGEETEGLGRLTGREQFSGSVRTATVDTRNKRNFHGKQERVGMRATCLVL